MDIEHQKSMTKDAIFRIYSMNKLIVTAAAIQLFEKGAFQLDDSVEKFISEFKKIHYQEDQSIKSSKRKMTIRDLMLHTSGLSYGFIGNGLPRII